MVHIIISIGRESADESDGVLSYRQLLIALVKTLIFRPWNWIVGIAFRGRELVADAGLRMFLTCQMLVLGHARERDLLGRVINDSDRLELRFGNRFMLEPKRTVRQFTKAIAKIFVNWAREDEVTMRIAITDIGKFDS